MKYKLMEQQGKKRERETNSQFHNYGQRFQHSTTKHKQTQMAGKNIMKLIYDDCELIVYASFFDFKWFPLAYFYNKNKLKLAKLYNISFSGIKVSCFEYKIICSWFILKWNALFCNLFLVTHLLGLLYTTVLNKEDWKKNPYVKIFKSSRQDK